MPAVEEVNSEDIGFKLSTDPDGVSIFRDSIQFSSEFSGKYRLFSFGNLTGNFACSNSTSLAFGKSNSLDNLEDFECKRLEGMGDLTQLSFTCDESRLILLTDKAMKFIDVSDLDQNDTLDISIVHEVEPVKGKEIAGFVASPFNPHEFIFKNMNDELILSKGDETTNLCSDVSFFSWGMDSDLIIYAVDSASTIYLFSIKESKIIKKFSYPSSLQEETYILNISQIKENFVFLVSFGNGDQLETECSSFIASAENSEVEFSEVEIALPFGSAERPISFYLTELESWSSNYNLFFITSSKATEVNLLSISKEGEVTVISPVNDYERAQMPINDDGDDSSPVGICIDLTSSSTVTEPCDGVEAVTGLPRVLVLTNEGTLIGWWIFDIQGIKNSLLNKSNAIEALKNKGRVEVEVGSEPEFSRKLANSEGSLTFHERSYDEPIKSNATHDALKDEFKEDPDHHNSKDNSKDLSFNKAWESGKIESTPFSSQFNADSSADDQGKISELKSSKEQFGTASLGFGGFGTNPTFGSPAFNFSLSSTASDSAAKSIPAPTLKSGFGAYSGQTTFNSSKSDNAGSIFDRPSETKSIFDEQIQNKSIFGKPIDASESKSIFGKPADASESKSIFGKPTETSESKSIFGKPTETSESKSIFGKPTETSESKSIFGKPADASEPKSIFGKPADASESKSIFGKPTETSESKSIFGKPTETSESKSIFGKPADASEPKSIFDEQIQNKSIFGKPIDASESKSIFGKPADASESKSIFGKPTETSESKSIFGKPTETSESKSIFGKPADASEPKSIFGKPADASESKSMFGKPTETSESKSIFGKPADASESKSIFGKPADASEPKSIFGKPADASESKSMFGKPTETSESKSIFGKPADASESKSIFGKPADASESKSMFGKPTETSESKSIFGKPADASESKSIFGKPADASESKSIFGKPTETSESKSIFGKAADASEPKSMLGTQVKFQPESNNLSDTNSNSEQPIEIKEVPSIASNQNHSINSFSNYGAVTESLSNVFLDNERKADNLANFIRPETEDSSSTGSLQSLARVSSGADSVEVHGDVGNILVGISKKNDGDTINFPSAARSEVDSKQLSSAEFPPPLTDITFLSFDGVKGSNLNESNDPISREMVKIANESSGLIEILQMNVDILKSFIAEHEIHMHGFQEKIFAYPELARLSNSSFILKQSTSLSEKIKDDIEELRHHDRILTDLVTDLQKSQESRIKIDKLLTQLAVFSSSDYSSAIRVRPLMFEEEKQKQSLRTKLSRVLSLEKKLISSMMPLKAKSANSRDILSNAEKVIFEINEKLYDHATSIDDLSAKLNSSNISQSSNLDSEAKHQSTYSATYAQKFSLKKRLDQVSIDASLINLDF